MTGIKTANATWAPSILMLADDTVEQRKVQGGVRYII